MHTEIIKYSIITLKVAYSLRGANPGELNPGDPDAVVWLPNRLDVGAPVLWKPDPNPALPLLLIILLPLLLLLRNKDPPLPLEDA
jgi:hypothetical protein